MTYLTAVGELVLDKLFEPLFQISAFRPGTSLACTTTGKLRQGMQP